MTEARTNTEILNNFARSFHVTGRTLERQSGQRQSLFATPESANQPSVAKETAVSSAVLLPLSSSEQTYLREQIRRLRLLCPLLRLHILLLSAQQRSPTEMANWLLCSPSSVYEVAAAWRQGWKPGQPPRAMLLYCWRLRCSVVCGRSCRDRRPLSAGAARAGVAPNWPQFIWRWKRSALAKPCDLSMHSIFSCYPRPLIKG